MTIYQKTSNEKSQVAFYKCSLCVAEHVSSQIVTASQLNNLSNQQQSNFRYTSHNLTSFMN